jgi:hypothetical protein
MRKSGLRRRAVDFSQVVRLDLAAVWSFSLVQLSFPLSDQPEKNAQDQR